MAVTTSTPLAAANGSAIPSQSGNDLLHALFAMRRAEIRAELNARSFPEWEKLSPDSKLLLSALIVIASDTGSGKELLIGRDAAARGLNVFAVMSGARFDQALDPLLSNGLVQIRDEKLHLPTSTVEAFRSGLDNRWFSDDLHSPVSQRVLSMISLGYPFLSMMDRFPPEDRVARKEFRNSLRISLEAVLEKRGPLAAAVMIDDFHRRTKALGPEMEALDFARRVTEAVSAAFTLAMNDLGLEPPLSSASTFEGLRILDRLKYGESPGRWFRTILDADVSLLGNSV